METLCERIPLGLKRHSSKKSKTPTPSSRTQNSPSIPTGLRPKFRTTPTPGICVSPSWTQTIPSPRKSFDHRSSCLQHSLLRTIGKKESTSNNATSAGNSLANTNHACSTRTEGRKDASHARNLAHLFADSAETGNTSKPNTISLAKTAFKPESPWRRSNRKTGSAPISNVRFAQNHISPTAKNAEDATMPSNKPEVANLSPTNPSLPRIPSNKAQDPPTQSSPQVTRPFPKGLTTLDTLAPKGPMHSKTSRPMLQLDPLIKHPAINLPYE